MARKATPAQPAPEPWPKEMAIRRLKEAYEEIAGLEGLNHRDQKFEAWRENLRRILQHNWPDERLPYFCESRMRLPGEPPVTGRDVAQYKRGLAQTKTQIELVLRNERELAEAQGDAQLMEVFIAPGRQHDAYQEIRQIISTAARDLVIIDSYVDGTLFQLLTKSAQHIVIKILTFTTPSDFALEGKKFVEQYRRTIEIRKDRNDFHDRFIIIDGVKVFHVGHSIKDAGTKAMMINEVQDKRNIAAVVDAFQKTWTTATALPL